MNTANVKNYFGLGRLVFAGMVCTMCAGSMARADIAFNNFGAGDTFINNSGYSETALAPGQSLAEGFTPTFSGTLSLITIAMAHTAGANVVHLYLADGSSGTPGTVLESWVVANLHNAGVAYSPLHVTSTAQPLLSAGNRYFLYSQETGDTQDFWNLNSIGEQGPYYAQQNSGAWGAGTHTQGAFRVEMTPIPEPSSVALCLGMVLVGLKVRGAGKRQTA